MPYRIQHNTPIVDSEQDDVMDPVTIASIVGSACCCIAGAIALAGVAYWMLKRNKDGDEAPTTSGALATATDSASPASSAANPVATGAQPDAVAGQQANPSTVESGPQAEAHNETAQSNDFEQAHEPPASDQVHVTDKVDGDGVEPVSDVSLEEVSPRPTAPPAVVEDSELLAPVEGVTVESYASCAAAAAQGLPPEQFLKVLADHGMDPVKWDRVNVEWTDRMSKDASMTIMQFYGNAFQAAAHGDFGSAGATVTEDRPANNAHQDSNPPVADPDSDIQF